MTSVDQLLKEKGHRAWSIAPDASVFEALQLLAEKNIGALLVLEDDQLVGVVSERDYARKVALSGKTSVETPVREIMTDEVISVGRQTTVDKAMALMTENHIRHLPVVDGRAVVGVVSIGDLVKAIIDDREFTIDQMQNYISGKRS